MGSVDPEDVFAALNSERISLGLSAFSNTSAWFRLSGFKLITPRVRCSVPGGRTASSGIQKLLGLVTSARNAARLFVNCALASCTQRKCVGLGRGGIVLEERRSQLKFALFQVYDKPQSVRVGPKINPGMESCCCCRIFREWRRTCMPYGMISQNRANAGVWCCTFGRPWISR